MQPTRAQIELFRNLFTGRQDVFGTHSPETGHVWQEKRPVTPAVIREHLIGRQPCGIYPLVGDRTRMVVVDFDVDDPALPLTFARLAARLGMSGYIERSKSKGHHVWCFLPQEGVPAWKPRAVVIHILKKMHQPNTEIFPKQDRLSDTTKYGNFIILPLCGCYASQGRCVFVDEHLEPYPDQWALLAEMKRIPESRLDDIINRHQLRRRARPHAVRASFQRDRSLPPCAQRMLREGVRANQRVACFRLAVQLRKAGNPFDRAVAILCAWAERNRPADGKSIIRESEIRGQTRCAYRGGYKGCGCEDPAVMPFCEPSCPVHRRVRV